MKKINIAQRALKTPMHCTLNGKNLIKTLEKKREKHGVLGTISKAIHIFGAM